MRTLIWSESTRVPPVTAERSPPASRMTGADSPVIADSSTDATPSTISPSLGMNSPADDEHDVVLAQVLRADRDDLAVGQDLVGDRFGARASQRVGLRLSAPLGHRFCEVREQDREPEPEGDLEVEPGLGRCRSRCCGSSRNVVTT